MNSAPASTPPSLHANYRADIDGLRAIAVVAVVIHHAFPELLPGGFVGVDVFFVISGYLISTIILQGLQRGRFSFAGFYVRRVKRIFPALLLVLATTMVMDWFQLIPTDYAELGKHLLGGATFVSNFLLWQEAGYFDTESHSKPLLHLWSLAIEEQFYLLWPLALYLLHRWRLSAMRSIAVILVLSFAVNLALVWEHPTAAFFNPAARVWELMLGALLAAVHLHPAGWRGLLGRIASVENPTPSLTAPVMAWSGALLLVLGFALVNPERAFPGAWALLPTLGTVLLIATGPHTRLNRTLLANRPMVWVGLISYPLYLWHWPLLTFAHLRAGETPVWTTQLAWVALSVLLAWLTYRLIEKPVRFGPFNPRAISAALCTAMVGVAVAGTTIQQREGFEERYPQTVRELLTRSGLKAVTQGWRLKDCMLEFEHPASDYKDFCIEEKRPLVFLWGDSHAGSLYPGFKALQDGGQYDFGIGERSSAGCPPVLGPEARPLCGSLNDNAIEAIRQSKPDVVLLYAIWHHPRYDISTLEATVDEIKRAGVPRVVLLGAVPYWDTSLPRVLISEWEKGPVTRPPPLRLNRRLDPRVDEMAQQLRARAEAMGIEFISGMDYFCNKGGCLTRLHAGATEPLSYDYGHLAPAAVRYFAEQLALKILPAR
ncbi:acyltransferase family protein [Hydrogenophaga palleronii]|uniref:acyltransferase family protein n=1 Tax=Hydrogenophaga palleronii TaxID=65655 RepID=UPI00286BEE9F|nr:acyltransferase family protein [Hydrogenophaga palleronii]